MAHTTILPDGTIVYRTALMERSRAFGFARCLNGNAGRFSDVEVLRSERAKGCTSWFVRFRPARRERQGLLLQREWDKRAARAEEEGGEYIFWPDPDSAGDYWCFNPKSGETYQVNCFRCTCPDFHYRCNRAGIQCKHQQAWELQSRAGRIQKAA